MSYDVYFVIDTGSGNEAVIDARNYTSNVSGMWAKALELPEKPWIRDGEQVIGYGPDGPKPLMNFGVRLLHKAPASEAAGVLAEACDRMRASPDEYRAMNPENGWGNYEGALEFLQWMADMAAAHPASVIEVSS